jgi:hypothetical protein
MIINFLQSRKPPILPSLHQRPHLKLANTNGLESSFADDLSVLKGFGSKNKETLGQLLFNFFRFYGHEFDYDKLVISVRSGKQISKVEKKWHLANNNTLCVEEPFNIGRNLGNTADDTSFRGLHMELRRGFDLISEGKLDECCQQYEFPKEEKPQRDRKAATPKPAIIRSASQSQPQRGGRGGGNRGGRQPNQHRNGNNNRRASASGPFDSHQAYLQNGMSLGMSAQETWIQQQAQAQLHNDLLSTYSVLQAQENTLRMQLYQQSQAYMHAQVQNQNRNPAYSQSQGRSSGSGSNLQPSDRNRTNSFDQAPRTAPLQQEQYFFPLPQYPSTSIYGGYQSPSTNPSSPSMSSAAPELRRGIHRASLTNGSGAQSNSSSLTNGSGAQSNSSMRSHSQPARSAPSHLAVQGMAAANYGLGVYQPYRHVNGVPINFHADENSDYGMETQSDTLVNTPPEATTPREYVGYYVNSDPATSTSIRRDSAALSSIPTFGEFPSNRLQDRRRSQHQLPQSVRDCLAQQRSARSPSPSPLSHERTYSAGSHSAPLTAVSSQQGVSCNNLQVLNNQNPPVVNGSNIPAPISIPHWQASVSESSEDQGVNGDISLSSGAASGLFIDQGDSGPQPSKDAHSEKRVEPPMVVNGSISGTTEAFPTFASPTVVNGAPPHQLNTPNGLTYIEQPNGSLRLSPDSRNRITRQGQNGGVSPLDIGFGQNELHREDIPHLSPVYETRTPSPTASRKFEPAFDRKLSVTIVATKESKSDNTDSGAKLGPGHGNQLKVAPSDPKTNGHTRGSRSEGNSPSGWQKIAKSKKKGLSSELKQSETRSEKLPNDNSERKGG